MPLQTAMQCLHTASISNATKQGEKLVANAISHMLQTMVLTEGGFLYVRLFLEFKYYIQHLENQYFNLDAKLKIQDTKFQFIG